MTLKGFLIASPLQWLFLALLKLWFFNVEIFTDPGVQELIFWAITAVFVVALVRRLGILNYLEALFLVIVWSLGNALLDLMFVSSYTGLWIFHSHMYWGGFVVMALAIMIFHKKRHVYLRRELHAKHHGQH